MSNKSKRARQLRRTNDCSSDKRSTALEGLLFFPAHVHHTNVDKAVLMALLSTKVGSK